MFEGLFGDPSSAPPQGQASAPAVKKTPSVQSGGSNNIGNLATILQAQLPRHQQPQHVAAAPAINPVHVPSDPHGGSGGAPPSAPPPPTPVPQVPQAPRCQALHAYEARSGTELGFQPGMDNILRQTLIGASGDVITIITKDPGGWWEGELNGRRGWLPSNFVQEL